MDENDWLSARMGAPVAIVAAWLEAVFDRSDLAAAWLAMNDELRLALAQSWICMEHDRKDVQSRNRDELAAALAAPDQPSVDLWDEFAGWRLVRWREVLACAHDGMKPPKNTASIALGTHEATLDPSSAPDRPSGTVSDTPQSVSRESSIRR